MGPDNQPSAHEILFGLNREEDERSLAAFLQLFSRKQLTSVLIPRMTEEEIDRTVRILTEIMRNHLNEDEYHTLFLGDDDHHH